jgi:membrane protease YdiL (CAAX protease family)
MALFQPGCCSRAIRIRAASRRGQKKAEVVEQKIDSIPFKPIPHDKPLIVDVSAGVVPTTDTNRLRGVVRELRADFRISFCILLSKWGPRMTHFNRAERETGKPRAGRELMAFFALTYTITFGLGIAVIGFRPQFEAVFGPIGPLLTSWPYYVAVCAPTISALLLSAVFGGLQGINTLFRGLTRPFQLRWMFVALLTFPIGLLLWGLAERALFGTGATHSIDIRAILYSAPLTLFTTANVFIDPGPWGEETGWRGFALPRLLTRFAPLTAAIILGVIWAVWHAPAFLTSDLTQAQYTFTWFLIGITCASIFMTWIYINANGNFLVAGFIPHAMNNLMGSSHAFTDAKIQAFVMMIIVAIIIAAYGPSLRGWRPTQLAPSLS